MKLCEAAEWRRCWVVLCPFCSVGQCVSEVTWVKLFKIIGILKLRLLMFMVKILDILEKDPFV